MRITQAFVEKLRASTGAGDEQQHFDDELKGFGVRRYRSGRVSFFAQGRLGRQQMKRTFGDAAKVTAAQARGEARAWLAEIGLRRDPRAEERRRRAALRVGEVVDLYLARHARKALKPRSLVETERHLRKHAAPLHRLALAELGRARVAELLHRLAETSGPATSNRVRASLSACFTWAVRAGLVEANPVAATPKQPGERPRERVLPVEELALVWRHAGSGAYADIVRLLILTGLRRGEVAGLLAGEVNLERAELVIGAGRMKAGREHRVPLPEAALAILRPRVEAARAGERVHLFGEGGTPFATWSRSKDRLDGRLRRAGHELAGWTQHDLRRSAATGWAELGVAPHVIEELLAHRSGHKAGVAGVYNRATYEPEKRRALELWAGVVLGAVEGEAKVVPLRRERRA